MKITFDFDTEIKGDREKAQKFLNFLMSEDIKNMQVVAEEVKAQDDFHEEEVKPEPKATKKAAAKPKAKPQPKAQPVEEKAPEPEQSETTEKPKKITRDMVKELVASKVQDHREALQGQVKKMGLASLNELRADQYAEFYKFAKNL